MPELVCAADSPDWLLERRKGITATDITAIVGLSPYESAYGLFFKKRGDIPDEHTDTPRLRLGRELEPLIVGRWREEHPGLFVSGHGLWRNDARPWQLATRDQLIWEGENGGPLQGVLEVKSWADMDRDSWADGPPPRVRAQVLWQMDTLDVAVGHVGVLFLPSGEFRSYTIEHELGPDEADPLDVAECDICQDTLLLRDAGLEFKNRLRDNDPPSPDASTATLAALKARFADPMRDKTAEISESRWEDYSKAKDALDHQAHWVKGLEAFIREEAGEARTLTVNGTPVATRIIAVQNVKAHTRHMDYIRRATSKGDTDA